MPWSFASLLTVAACSPASSTADMASTHQPDMVFFSCCGQKGDTGNSKGVGKFCTVQADCSGTPSSTLCAAAYEPAKRSYFCTIACSGTSDTTTCGENATCTQDSSNPGLYGCVPNSCLANEPAGCSN